MLRPRLRAALAALALLLLPVLSVSAPARAADQDAAALQAGSFANPVKSTKGADPWIRYHDGAYYLISTSWTSELTMRRSPTLAGLDSAPSIQVYAETDAARCCNMWAPELHLLDGHDGPRWYIYYTAGPDVPDFTGQRIHVLESEGTDPLGPYAFRGTLNPPGSDIWQIDGSPLRLNGSLYLMGSYWEGGTQNLFIAPMSSPYTVSGARRRLSAPTLGWERQGLPVQEGPVALHRDGRTFVVYATSYCASPDYKLGMLTYLGGDPLSQSSWRKSPEPVFQRDDAAGVYGPGHNGFFTSPDGTEDWIVYHGNDAASDGCDNMRTARAQPFGWNADGTPDFGTPVALGQELPAPSGETAATPTGYALVNRNSGHCLDVADGSTADGADVRQWGCNGTDAQRWLVQDLGDDTSRLLNAGSGKALDVANCGTADGVDVRQWSWLDNTCQRFRMVTTDQGWVHVVNANSGKALDVANCGTAEGVDIRQWSRLDNACQQWRLEPIG